MLKFSLTLQKSFFQVVKSDWTETTFCYCMIEYSNTLCQPVEEDKVCLNLVDLPENCDPAVPNMGKDFPSTNN